MLENIMSFYVRCLKFGDPSMEPIIRCVIKKLEIDKFEDDYELLDDIICLLMNVRKLYEYYNYIPEITESNFESMSEYILCESRSYMLENNIDLNYRNLLSIFLDNLLLKDFIKCNKISYKKLEDNGLSVYIESYKMLKDKILDKIEKYSSKTYYKL